jgi:hypothetical protein
MTQNKAARKYQFKVVNSKTSKNSAQTKTKTQAGSVTGTGTRTNLQQTTNEYHLSTIALLNRLNIQPEEMNLVGLIAFSDQSNNYQSLNEWLARNITKGHITLPTTLNEFEAVYWRLRADIDDAYLFEATNDY